MPRGDKNVLQVALESYLDADEPNDNGEWDLHCPLHDDNTRSASANFEKGKWYCHACGLGGSIKELVEILSLREENDFVPMYADEKKSGGRSRSKAGAENPLPSEGKVAGWHAALMSNRKALLEFQEKRGLNVKTLTDYQVGWDTDQKVYTLPIRDDEGALVNVRFYDLNPKSERRKIWGVTGHNTPTLFPNDQLSEDKLVICEGEWDALVAIQEGFPAVTRTASATTWNPKWNEHFRDRTVYVCHDTDNAGAAGTRKVVMSLKGVAAEVRVVELPYERTDKHGKDLTDYFVEDGHTKEEFKILLKDSAGEGKAPIDGEFVELGVLGSFDADQAGKRLRLRVTITGKKNPTYLIPEDVEWRCTMDAGAKCAVCPMYELEGEADRTVPAHDPIILEMMGSSHKQVDESLRQFIGAQKCNHLNIETVKFRSVEELTVRPSVEIARIQAGDPGDYTNRRIVSVGRHDTMSNNTVEIGGTIYPNPRSQHNEFQAWELERTETSIDRFEMTPQLRKDLKIFQTSGSPLKKVADISKELSRHVTKIYGRPQMHAAMDLVYHSALQFEFGGTLQNRGWLELLVVGDTRTGKSEVASKLLQYYSAGEMLSCESSTFAGVVGGLQQVGGKEWEITWGAIPLNDRRLVILDEVSGLRPEEIAQMSSIRSSGEAQLTKIRSERTWARTRLIWMGNPRNKRMSDFTFGVQAIAPLIGNSEDIARFDFAMSVAQDEVDAAEINKVHMDEFTPNPYPQELCQALVQWVWSRRAEHVYWGEGAQDEVYKAALDLGGRYMEVPPLIQAANVRIKVARLAVALAGRTYSTDRSGEILLVKKVHVQDAVKFLDILYGMKSFGYRDWSAEQKAELTEAAEHFDEAREYLTNNPDLSKFLRSMGGQFRSQDLQDMLNLDREMANAIINTLWQHRMISRQNANIKIQPLLHEILREVRS